MTPSAGEDDVDARLRVVLDELHREGVEHDRGEPERVRRFRNLEPESAAVLALLVRATAAERVLELGTSNGYSTLWLAEAVAGAGGHLLSVDVDAGRSALAARNLERAGLAGGVELRVEDAADTLRASERDTWDLVFLDAERSAYAGYWPGLARALRPGGLLVVDNVLSHAEEVRELRALIDADAGVDAQAVLATGAGLLLVVLERERSSGAG
jgi:predicted O-methyltransferase YrrM